MVTIHNNPIKEPSSKTKTKNKQTNKQKITNKQTTTTKNQRKQNKTKQNKTKDKKNSITIYIKYRKTVIECPHLAQCVNGF